MTARNGAERPTIDPWLFLAGLSGLVWLVSSGAVNHFFKRLAFVLGRPFGI